MLYCAHHLEKRESLWTFGFAGTTYMVMENQMIAEIQKLKKEKNAIILAHYYVNDDL